MGVFDKITKTINSAGENVAKKAKDVTEISKCGSRIEESKTRIKSLYIEIGKYCWENRQSLNADDQLNKFFLQLEQENQTISELEDTIRQLKGIEICANCGAELVKGANFCNVCGAPVVRKTKDTPVCANCGAELGDDEIFCQNCGARVKPLAPEAEPTPAPAEEPVSEPVSELETAEPEAEPVPEPETEEPESKPTPETLMPGIRICPNCQEKIGKDERFCKNCGTPVLKAFRNSYFRS